MCCKGLAEWKKANFIPLFKKGDRQLRENYRPVSLLDSLSKITEKIVFTRLYTFLDNMDFFTTFHSGFRPCDGTVFQLTLIVHRIFEALEKGKEVRMVFLDLSKAFDRVWHKGLLFKLSNIGVKGALLDLFYSYLSNRHQRVVLEGQCSNWSHVETGVPQGSVLGPLLFLIYINDICKYIQSNCFLNADDTSLFEIVDDPASCSQQLNNDLAIINQWCNKWLMKMNTSKCEAITFSVKRVKPVHPTLFYENTPICEVRSHKHLGLTLSHDLSWSEYISHIINLQEG